MSKSLFQRTLLPFAALCATSLSMVGQVAQTPAGQPQIQEFVVEAAVPLASILSPGAPSIPADILAQLQAGTLQARERVAYNPARNILTVWGFLATPSAPLPSTVLPSPLPPTTISMYEIAPEAILQSASPKPHLLFAGRVVTNSVVSPFGNLTGSLAAVTVGYDPATPSAFTAFGVTVGGSHSLLAPTGIGSLRLTGAATGGGTGGGGGTTPGNRPPVADVGPSNNIVVLSSVVELDASRSTDPDGDPLTYQWRAIGPQASISNANQAKAQVQFGPSVGDYVFEVTVSDNKGNSSTARLTVSVR